MNSRLFSSLALLAFAALLALTLMLILGLLGAWHPAFDSFSHFRAHLAVAAALTAIVLLASRFRLHALAALVFAIACFSTTSNTLSYLGLGQVQAGFEPKLNDRHVYSLLQMNLRFNNRTPEKVLSLIGRLQPDVMTLEETSDMWEGKLALISHAYPHKIVCGGLGGSAILSRRPFVADSQPRCFENGAMATARIDFGGVAVDVAAIHLRWPWPGGQSRQIAALSEPLSSLADTAIAAGDLNAVPWSNTVRRVADEGGLTVMPSVGPTWLWRRLPASVYFAGLPIDQVFSKGDVLIHSAEKLEPEGSDHLPVLVEFSLKPTGPEPADEHVTALAQGPLHVSGL